MKTTLILCSSFALPLLLLAIITDTGHGQEPGQGDQLVLFDGTHLDAWRGYNQEELPSGWVIEEQALHCKSGGGDIITKEKFRDFDLLLEWKIGSGGNSGIMYRVREGDPATYLSGPEYQILDNTGHRDGHDPSTSAAALYGLYACSEDSEKSAGEWNTARIVVQGNHIQHWLNGKKVVECELDSDDWKQRLADSKFADWEQFAKSAEGHIALQDHGDPVWYRNIKITRLTPAEVSH